MSTATPNRLRKRIQITVGYLIAALSLVWVFHDVEWRRVGAAVANMRWDLIALAVGFDIGSYFAQGLRWSLLLAPWGRLSPFRATQAIYCGLFVNEVVPLRAGELVRTYLVARWFGVRFAEILPSVLVERFFDAVWLAFAFGVTVLAVPLPRYLVEAEDVLGIAVLAGAGLFLWVVLRKRETSGEPAAGGPLHPLRWLRHLAATLAEGLHRIGRSRLIYLSLAASGLVLACQIAAYWLVLRAYGVDCSFWVGAAVLLILHVGTAIPGPPSNVGTYQFFTVLGLTLFGIDKTTAGGFSLVVFLILTVPLWALGLLAFGKAGLTLARVRSEIAALRR